MLLVFSHRVRALRWLVVARVRLGTGQHRTGGETREGEGGGREAEGAEGKKKESHLGQVVGVLHDVAQAQHPREAQEGLDALLQVGLVDGESRLAQAREGADEALEAAHTAASHQVRESDGKGPRRIERRVRRAGRKRERRKKRKKRGRRAERKKRKHQTSRERPREIKRDQEIKRSREGEGGREGEREREEQNTHPTVAWGILPSGWNTVTSLKSSIPVSLVQSRLRPVYCRANEDECWDKQSIAGQKTQSEKNRKKRQEGMGGGGLENKAKKDKPDRRHWCGSPTRRTWSTAWLP